jgi:hypothetical protein
MQVQLSTAFINLFAQRQDFITLAGERKQQHKT